MRFIITALILILSASAVFGQTLTGTVKNSTGKPLPYSTVALLKADSTIVTGTTCNGNGDFSLTWHDSGKYILQASFVGYEKSSRLVSIPGDSRLGEIILAEKAFEVGRAVVKADMIRRKADGYMFYPEGSPITNGHTTLELLNYAPGVWYQNGKGISINGRSGTRVMINDREMKLSDEELASYLENIDAEQIRSIEVIPNSGAQYDASATGGIIKITLKRSPVGGLTGSAGVRADMRDSLPLSSFRPTINLEYRKNKLSLYTNLSYNKSNGGQIAEENTQYLSGNLQNLESRSKINWSGENHFGRIGTVYEFNPRHSAGIEFDISKNDNENHAKSYGNTRFFAGGSSLIESLSESDNLSERYGASFNYKIKTDEKGSGLIFVADYMLRDNVYWESNGSAETPDGGITVQNNTATQRATNFANYSARIDYKQLLGEKVQLDAGGKYTYSNIDTELDNEIMVNDIWESNEALDDRYLYREGVLAGYINGTFSLKPFNIIAGLRGENTSLRPYSYKNPGNEKNKNYTDFFPTINLMYFLNENKGNSLTLSYNTRIRRPGFNDLNPFKIQINNYTYVIGNPDMKPSYSHNYDLTCTAVNKYTLTFGIEDQYDVVFQIVKRDLDNPDILYYQNTNVDRITRYLLNFNAPIEVAKWWKININASYYYSKNRVKENSLESGTYNGRMNNLFALPKKWSFEINGFYSSASLYGNMEIEPQYSLSSSVSKGLFDNKLNLSFFVDNILDKRYFTSTTRDPGYFVKLLHASQENMARTYRVALRWNFKAGKTVKVQKVVIGNEEERSR